MPAPPNVAPFAGLLADLAAELRRGSCCLVVCDKGWTLPIYADLRERLRAMNVKCGYLDGRSTENPPNDMGVMLAAVAQMRWAARSETEGVVFALPHLDVMTTPDGGWTTITREVIPLLYENAATIWLGFRDPTLPLLPIVEKLFSKRYVLDAPYRIAETVTPQEVALAVASHSEPATDLPSEADTEKQEPPPATSSDEPD